MGKPSRRKISKHLGVIVQHIKAHVPADVGLEVFVFHKLALIGDTKPELAIDHRATGQGLSCDNLSSGATRRVGRRAVAVVERHQGLLDLVLAALVDRLMRALGTTGDGRRGSERTGGVVGDGDRHGAHGVIVGVTGLVVVLLGHGVLEGLAGVSLRKCNLMTSQDVDQADCCLCRCRRLEVVGSGQQTERASRRVVSGCHGKGELALGHGAAVQILAEPQTAGRDVIELSAVLVSKASVFLLGDVGFQVALAVLGHGHFGGRDMSIIRHADRATRVLADLVLVGSGSRVVNLAELDGSDAVLRIVLVHGHGCGIGQRGAIGGGDGKAELVPIRPLATVDGLAQAKVEVCIGRGHAVGVGELGGLGILQLVLSAERTVAVVRDDGLDGELGVAVSDALADGSALGLAQRVSVRSGLVVFDGTHRDLAAGVVGAGSNNLGVLALALDELKAKLSGLEVAPGQALGRDNLVGDTELVGVRLVAVVELRLVSVLQLVLRLELALAVVGDGRLDGVSLAIVGDAVALGACNLAQRVGVLAGLGVLDGAHRDLAVSSVLAGGDDLGVLALALDELEGELAVLEVASGQALGRDNLVGDTELVGVRLVAVVELRLVGVLQLVLNVEGTVAVVRNRSHDGVLGGAVGNAVLGGAGLGLAQRVSVFAGLSVRDGIHHDLAVGVVGTGGDDLVVLDELKAELAGHKAKLAPGQDLSRVDLVGDAGVLGGHGVGVHKLVAGIAVDSRRRQGTIAVVDNGYICVNYRHGGAHARRQPIGLLGSNVANGPRGLV